MKKQIKRFLILIGVFIAFCIFNQNKVNAASASISGSQTVTAGQTVTVTATVNAGAWNLTLSGGGQSKRLLGYTSSDSNESASTSITFVATQNTTVTLTGDITDISSNYSQTVNQSAQITVQSASTGGSGNTSSGNNQNSGNGSGTSGTTGGGTSGTTNGGTTGSSSGSSTTTNNTPSSNANLSNLGIRPNDFSGFTPNRTSYSVTVPNSVTSIEVYANVGQSGQKISGTGTKNLSEGTNSFNVIATAPDGTTTKTYTIAVTREKSEENEDEDNQEENQEEQNAVEENTEVVNGNSVFGLTELKIDGIELNPSFSTEIYEYSAKLIGDKDKLDITATASEENAKVEITGNEGLVEGENLITILVTNEAGDKTAAYQIKLTKSLVDEEAIAREQELEKEQQNRRIIAIVIVVVVILIIAIILILRRRRNKKLAEEYAIPYQGMDDDGDYEDEDNSYQKITDKFDNVEKDDWFNRDLTTQETDTGADLIEENQEPGRKKRKKKKSKNIDEFDDNIENEDINDDTSEEYEFKPAFSSKEELRNQYLNQSFNNNIPFEDEKRKGKGKRFK